MSIKAYLKINNVLIIHLCLILSCSCTQKRDHKIIASVGDEVISTAFIDNMVEKELYYNLCNIYDLRETALRDYLKFVVLRKTAEDNGLPIDSILSIYYTNTNINIVDEETRERYIDSLFTHYGVKIMMKEPISPIINLDTDLSHSRGNINSKTIITEISDYDCGMCSYMHKSYMELLNKYGNRIHFNHISFSKNITPASMAAYAAGLQDRYWEMSDTLMLMPITADSTKVMNIAMSIGLDMDQFINDYTSIENRKSLIEYNAYLSQKGITRTPTILLNGHILRKPEDIKYITRQIEIAINE